MLGELAGNSSAHEMAPTNHLLGADGWMGDFVHVIYFIRVKFIEAVVYILEPGKETGLDLGDDYGRSIEGDKERVELGPTFVTVGAHALVRTFEDVGPVLVSELTKRAGVVGGAGSSALDLGCAPLIIGGFHPTGSLGGGQ